MKPEDCTQWFVNLGVSRSFYRDLIKQYGHSKGCRNIKSLVASGTSSKNDPTQTVIENNKDASNSKRETFEVSSQKSATNRSRKELSIVNSRWLRQPRVEQMELENLMATQDAEKQLRDRQIQLEKEREEIKLRHRK